MNESWMSSIGPDTPTWGGLSAYIEQRKEALTGVCLSKSSSEPEIRAAQAGIEELNRILALPDAIKASAQVRGQTNRSKGY